MRPYFDTPVAGAVLMALVLCWLVVEFAEFLRVQDARAARTGTVKTRNPAIFWFSCVACLVVAEACLYGAPHVFPAAEIRPGAAAFAAGVAVFVAGAVKLPALGEEPLIIGPAIIGKSPIAMLPAPLFEEQSHLGVNSLP